MASVLVIDPGYEMSLGTHYAPMVGLRSKTISVGYVADLIRYGHNVIMARNYEHAVTLLGDNSFGFDWVIINLDEVNGGGLDHLGLAGALYRFVKAHEHLRLLAQLECVKTDFLAMVPTVSRIVHDNFSEAGFKVFVVPKRFTDLKRKLRRLISNGTGG